jgi:uncharacterized membrane protein
MDAVNLICFVTNLFVCALCGVLMPILPILTRKSFLFGVKIPMEAQTSPEARELKRKYITVCIAGTAVTLALVIAQYVAAPDKTLLATMYFPFLFVLVQLLAFIPNWKRAVRLKEERGWKVSNTVFADTKTSFTRGNLSELPWLWYIASFICIFVALIIAVMEYPSMPDIIPTHWGADMQPDGWSEKSWAAMLAVPICNVAMTVIMLLTGVMFVKAKLQIDQQNPALSFTQHRLYRRWIGHSIGFLTLALAAMFALLGLMSVWPEFNALFWPVFGLTFLASGPLVVVSIAVGQGGCRIKPKVIVDAFGEVTGGGSDGGSGGVPGRGDDKFWALGMFYHNPDDPANIVEDRFGNNLGFNYSRLPVKIGIALAIPAFIALYAWLTVVVAGV